MFARGQAMPIWVEAQAYMSLTAALAAEPRHAGALTELGALYRGCGLLPEAVATLRAAAAARPGDAAMQHALAVVLTDLGVLPEQQRRACAWDSFPHAMAWRWQLHGVGALKPKS